jgi:AraC family transcriptional regulator of adaptative response / DNA-3-methyladenine glycosylase II
VKVELSASLLPVLSETIHRLRALFDLDAEPLAIAEWLGADPLLAPLVAREPGRRVPGAFDAFEVAMRTILGQQVTIAAASTLMGRLTAAFAEPAETPFPKLSRWPISANVLAAIEPEQLGRLCILRQRSTSIRALAEVMAKDSLPLTPGSRPSATIRQLLALPGIGPWTAQYLAMRALRWPDAFPAADLGVRSALGHLSPRQAEIRSAAWSPWRSYAVMHLWSSLPAPRISKTQKP